MTLRIGELFSGYGGLGMGVQAAIGGQVVWHSDIDPGACKILAHRYPDVPNLGDVTAVDWTRVEPVDVLTGGTPCQDLSHAGKRGGMTEGTRSNLWVAMREAIAALRPPVVVWENVRGALSAPADSELESREGRVGVRPGGPVLRALGRVLGDLASLGYVGGWHGLRAADVGAPHGRFRVFVVAHARGEHGGQRRLAAPREAPRRRTLSEPAGRGGVDALLPSPRATDGTKGGPGQRGSSGDLMLPSAVALLPTPTSRDHKGANQRGDVTCLHGALVEIDDGDGVDVGSGGDRVGVRRPSAGHESDARSLESVPHDGLQLGGALGGLSGGNDGVSSHGETVPAGPRSVNGPAVKTQRLLSTPTAAAATGGPPQDSRGKRDLRLDIASSWGQYAAAIARWEAVLGRPAPPPTQPSRKGTPQLSAAFSEWLMGLPDGWVTDVPGITRNEALRALGNGVVPQQAAAALRFLLTLREAS